MGFDTKKLRNRIKSVNSTMHLTKAMGLVASSKIRKALDAMSVSRDYSREMEKAVMSLASSAECRNSPFLRKNGEKTRLVVIAGDRGLAGGYNANVFRLLRNYPDAEVIPIGKKIADRLRAEPLSVERFSTEQALRMAEKLCRGFADGEYDRLGIICTRYISMMTQEAVIKWVLPIIPEEKASRIVPVFEPGGMKVLSETVKEYVAGTLIAEARESFASEVAARRCAMDAADKNAQVMLDDLHLAYNRARQGSITQELIEIVSGGNT
ncbi:MAG: ATP synthase F1 subunit gamma [Clostridia bacterium]|nr:ATP synthase F1 subunit gamma [Clostridia bacterium]